MGWAHRKKYDDLQRQFVATLWADGKSSQEIADIFARRYGQPCTRNSIIGIVNRLKLVPRPDSGPWRMSGQRRREANRLAKLNAPQTATEAPTLAVAAKAPKTPPPRKDLPEPPPVGPVFDFPDRGGCKWPVSGFPTFQCCGHPAYGSSPYCEHHKSRSMDHSKRTNLAKSGEYRADRIR